MTPALEWVTSTLTSLSQMGYTGKVEFNFHAGGVTGVNLAQSIKPLTEVRVIPIGREIQVTLN